MFQNVTEESNDTNVAQQNVEDIRLHRLIKIISQYNDQMVTVNGNIDNIQISTILDDYIYLLSNYNTDEQFEYIVNQLGHCDITKCQMFKRNYRNRRGTNPCKASPDICHIDVIQQILDKIHCYFQHCFDIGNRLCLDEKIIIKQLHQNSDGNVFNECIMKRNKVLQSNKEEYGVITSKFTQLNVFRNTNVSGNANAIYSFGTEFIYESDIEYTPADTVKVVKKYNSLKEELTTNTLSTMSMSQFNNELEKAKIHFNTEYCKSKFRTEFKTIQINHILSLMVYCNYDTLQYEFSKTYRENISDHNNYYWLGKYLKNAIHQFGTLSTKSKFKHFFHGINQQLQFPRYIHGICIKCPLSTSSEYNVAINFSNGSEGMIVEFDGSQSFVKYFSVGWLSDYGNECEHLFIQNEFSLNISDIRYVQDDGIGYKYSTLLSALRIIDSLFSNQRIDDTEIQPIELVKSIINHQTDQHKSSALDSLTSYGKQMINAYCNNKTRIEIDIDYIKKRHSVIFELLFESNYEWIKIKYLHRMFPNMVYIAVNHAILSSYVMDDIVYYYWTLSNLKHVELRDISNRSDMTTFDAKSRYSSFSGKFHSFIISRTSKSLLVMLEKNGMGYIPELKSKYHFSIEADPIYSQLICGIQCF